ncbi:MAG: hypothetical protein H6862_07715 [Rhodospirillales bacterium]|nr:hypothetical protein [Rhodospirillales bacterium]
MNFYIDNPKIPDSKGRIVAERFVVKRVDALEQDGIFDTRQEAENYIKERMKKG